MTERKTVTLKGIDTEWGCYSFYLDNTTDFSTWRHVEGNGENLKRFIGAKNRGNLGVYIHYSYPVFERAKGRCVLLRLIQVFGLLFCATYPLLSQVAIDQWTADNGLPMNTVRGICQTPEGYLWLATMDGLVRFDGIRFTTFNNSNTKGIRGNRFNWMACTAGGEFWAGTESSGVTRYDHGRFTTYTVRDGLPGDNISGVLSDKRGNIWVLARGGVVRWSADIRRFAPLDKQKHTYAYSLNAYGSSVFYGVDRTAVHLFVQGEQVDYPLPAQWPRDVSTTGLLDHEKYLWLLTTTGKRARFVDGHWSMVSCTASAGCNARLEELASYYRDSKGTIWRSAIELESGPRYVSYLVLPAGSELRKIAFNMLFEDREGNIWLATDGQGLCRVRAQTIRVYSREEGLPDRNVYPIYQDRAGRVWIGTWSGGLCLFNGTNCTNYSTAQGLASDQVGAIAEDRDGYLWFSVSQGLYRMKNGRLEYRSNDLVPSEFMIRAIHQDQDGAMWFGGDQGLIRLAGGYRTLLTKKNGLAADDVRVVINGCKGNLWIGGYGGLSSLYRGRVRAWTDRDGLPSNTIRALYEDAAGVLWIGTYDGGLGRLENGRFTRYTIREGLFNNGVFQILEDSRANLWMSCNRGIYYVSKRQLNDFAAGRISKITSVAYGKRDGMRNVECNGGLGPNGFKAHDGKLWFPTQDGVAVVDPEKLRGNIAPPPVIIESIAIDHAPVAFGRPLQITPDHENLEIQYTALSFISSERIRFRYQLSGLDRDWVEAGTRRAAYYSHLPAGNYIFRVSAAHDDGTWNPAGASVPIVVLPPYYRTWWFTLLLLALAVTSLSLFWRHRLKRFERAQAAQQAFSRQLIASQENERKRIAAELHDSLGQRLVIIKNLALLALQNRNGAGGLSGAQREQVEEISAEVSGAVREVKEIAYNLRPFQLDRLGLTAAVRSLIESAAAVSSITFSAEIGDIDGLFPRDAEINFYRIVQECLNNIVKHSLAEHALAWTERSGPRLTLTISDDGTGFVSESTHADRPLDGFGLTGISERRSSLGERRRSSRAPDRERP